MISSHLGNGVHRNTLLGQPKPSHSRPLTRASKRRSTVLTRAVADFVKEKPSTGSNGAVPVQLKVDESSLETDILRKANYVVGSEELEPFSAYRATALSVREHLIEAFNKTQKFWK